MLRRDSTRALQTTLSLGVAAAFLAGCATVNLDRADADSPRAQAEARGTIDPTYLGGAPIAPPTRADGPSLERYYRRAAEIAMAERQFYGAVAHLSKLHQENPRDKDVSYDLARHLRYIGAATEADGVITSALQIHPSDTLLKLEQAKIRVAQGRHAEAVALLEPLRAARPRDAAILLALGVAHDHLGDSAAAREAYDTAIALPGPSASLLNNAGLSRLIGGDADGAVALLRRAQAAPGATPQVSQNLALALTLAGQRSEAERVVQSALPPARAERAIALLDRFERQPEALQDAWSVVARAQ